MLLILLNGLLTAHTFLGVDFFYKWEVSAKMGSAWTLNSAESQRFTGVIVELRQTRCSFEIRGEVL